MESREYRDRGYRLSMRPDGLDGFRVVQGESDLMIFASGIPPQAAVESLARHRSDLEEYIATCPVFATSFSPVRVGDDAPSIVREMAEAASAFGVGPMASVAGAVAQFVGRDLLRLTGNVIVENGGDVFLAGGARRTVRIFAGAEKPGVDVSIVDAPDGVGLCSSSATVGPSVSLGTADAVTVLAGTATAADAAATALGNMVRSADDISRALESAEGHREILGALVIAGGAMGVWGAIELA